MVGIPDVITYANFGDDRLRGLGVVGVKFAIPHGLLSSSLQHSHYYRASVWILESGCYEPDALIMAIIFLPRGFFLSFCLSFFLFSSPNLSGRRLHVYHTLTHDVALVQI